MEQVDEADAALSSESIQECEDPGAIKGAHAMLQDAKVGTAQIRLKGNQVESIISGWLATCTREGA